MQIKTPEKFLSAIEKIKTAASENKFEVYAVGGFVRDIILGREPYDLDIMAQKINSSQDGKFDAINLSKLIAEKYGLSAPVVFEKFGTSKLIIDGEEVEFVMPRKEYYAEDSRNPDTELGSLEQDALRRDFTVNALFLRLGDDKVLDLTGLGFKDLKDKVLRVTDPENADIIFSQDPLRILRAVRQSLQLGFEIEPDTYKAMQNNALRISIVSPERVRDELNKILLEKKPSQAFKMLDDIGLLKEIPPQDFEVLDKVPADLVLRLAALNISREILNNLKYPKDMISAVCAAIDAAKASKNYSKSWTDADIRRFVKEYGDNFYFIPKELSERIEKLKAKNMLCPKEELISGQELIDYFKKPAGQWVGKAKAEISEMQIENPRITKAEALMRLVF